MIRGLVTRNRVHKLLGISAVLGVAATGVVLARRERERSDYTPTEVRDHLRRRYADALAVQREAEAGMLGSE